MFRNRNVKIYFKRMFINKNRYCVKMNIKIYILQKMSNEKFENLE